MAACGIVGAVVAAVLVVTVGAVAGTTRSAVGNVAASSPASMLPSAPPPAGVAPLVILPTADASPLPESIRPPAGSRIAYVQDEDGISPSIRIVSADGTDDTIMAQGTLPSWAPDGKRIAYTCKPGRTDAIGSVCVRDLGSGTTEVVIEEGTRARWAPVGELIAFSRDVFALGDAWIFRPGPPETWQLPGGMPEWSPTGRRLRSLSGRGEPERPVIHVVRPGGSGERDLGEGWNATWSPDGSRIAATWWDGARSTVTAVDIRTGAREPLLMVDAPLIALRWLPGGGLAFVAEHDQSSTGDLFVFEQATSTVRSLTSGLDVTPELTVSPDGEWLAFAVATAGRRDIYVASRQGGWVVITTSGHATRPAWGP